MFFKLAVLTHVPFPGKRESILQTTKIHNDCRKKNTPFVVINLPVQYVVYIWHQKVENLTYVMSKLYVSMIIIFVTNMLGCGIGNRAAVDR